MSLPKRVIKTKLASLLGLLCLLSMALGNASENATENATENASEINFDWNKQQMQSSYQVLAQENATAGKVKLAPTEQTLLISDNAGKRVWLIDTEHQEILDRVAVADNLITKALLSIRGRYIYFASQTGWIRQYDRLKKAFVAKIKVAMDTRTMALSHDGRYLAIGNYQPRTVVILKAEDLTPLKVLNVNDGFGQTARVNVIHTNALRETFTIALEDMPQAWEVSYADDPPPGFSGWEHSYQPKTGDLVKSKPFPVRRLMLKGNLTNFRFGPDFISLIGSNSAGLSQVVDFDIRRTLFTIDILQYGNLNKAAIWNYKNKPVLVSSQKLSDGYQVIDTETWRAIKTIASQRRGGLIRSHPESTFAFALSSFADNKNSQLLVIDKTSLAIVNEVKLPAGVIIDDVQFSHDGKLVILKTTMPPKQKEADKLELLFFNSNTLVAVKKLSLTP